MNLQTVSFRETTTRKATSFTWWQPKMGHDIRIGPALCLSFACSPPLHPSLHCSTSGSAFHHDNRQQLKLGDGMSTRREQTQEHKKKKKRKKRKSWETERDREGDGWSEERRHTDGHSPTDGELWGHLEDTWGSYEPIWFLLQERPSVTNGKVGAGKHISVTARHCRKNKLNSLLAFHTLSTLFSLSPSITHFLPLWFSISVSQFFFVRPSLSFHLSFCLASVSFLLIHSLAPSLSSPFHCVHPKIFKKQGHMRGDSKQNCAPDVPAEAVKRLSAGRAHFSPAQDVWTVGKHWLQCQTTRWLLSGCVYRDETGSVMKLLGPCVDSLLHVQWLSKADGAELNERCVSYSCKRTKDDEHELEVCM